jgi:hypothetical protein
LCAELVDALQFGCEPLVVDCSCRSSAYAEGQAEVVSARECVRPVVERPRDGGRGADGVGRGRGQRRAGGADAASDGGGNRVADPRRTESLDARSVAVEIPGADVVLAVACELERRCRAPGRCDRRAVRIGGCVVTCLPGYGRGPCAGGGRARGPVDVKRLVWRLAGPCRDCWRGDRGDREDGRGDGNGAVVCVYGCHWISRAGSCGASGVAGAWCWLLLWLGREAPRCVWGPPGWTHPLPEAALRGLQAAVVRGGVAGGAAGLRVEGGVLLARA